MAKSDTSPAYLWYPKDVFSSGRIDELSAQEECWYRRALDRSWLDGGIPSDPAKCAAHIGKKCTAKAAAKIIEIFFKPKRRDPSKVVNPRQEIERASWLAKKRQKSAAGVKGMRNRWKQKDNGDNTVITENNIPIPIPTLILKKNKRLRTTTTTAAKICDDEWLDDLQKNSAYERIGVRVEFARAQVWCETNNRQCTRRFFVGWLNRAKPMDVKGDQQNGNRRSEHANTKALREWDEFAKTGKIPT